VDVIVQKAATSQPQLPTEASTRATDQRAAEQARVGTLLDAKWHLDSVLGRGGMATVYAATHRTTRGRAAVKVLHLEFAQDDDVRERFVREARIANSIQHPARVAVLDEGLSDQGEIFLVMDLLEGSPLDVHMRREGARGSVEEKLRIFDPVLDLLGECHAASIIHRDIKPANIFLTSSGQVKVLDFGIARLRENRGDVDPTRQGTVLGTPAFMAPEQALGLSDLVDGRADLWSVGACMYTMITGHRVHRARSENESMVLAATKAADSIAIAMPDLAVEVVSFIDKALAHDRSHRFPDAATMRAELGTLLAALRTGQVTQVKRQRGDALVVKSGVTEDEEVLASTELRNRALERMRSIWKNLGNFVTGSYQYGAQHPVPSDALRLALEEINTSLAARPDSVVWDVSPYAFTYAKAPIWEPERIPFDRVPYALFGHGLRKVQLRAGVTEDELRACLAIIARDRKSGLSLTDDPVADLWAQRFEHIAYQAIDSFAVGDADEVEGFEAEAEEVAQGALELSLVAKGWEEFQLDSLEARAMQANLTAGLETASKVASQLAIDVPTRASIGAQVALPAERWTERYVDVLAAGLLEGVSGGDAEAVASSLAAWTGEQVAKGASDAAFGLFGSLGTALAAGTTPDLAEVIERIVAGAMFETATLSEALRKLAARADRAGGDADWASAAFPPDVTAGIERVLALRDASFFDVALDHWLGTTDSRVRGPLVPYIRKWAGGREAALGSRIEQGPSEAALALIDLVGTLATSEAGAAFALGLKSEHPEVRQAALRALGDDDVHGDVTRLLHDPVSDLRCEALRVVARRKLRTVGPLIVRRIQQESFQSLGSGERKEWLVCLHALHPARGEEIAIEMLGHAPMIPNDANDRNRILALDVLAGSDSGDALAAVKKAARTGWWNSPLVREAASRALAVIAARTGGSSS
jgi:serine/threonine protein kinase